MAAEATVFSLLSGAASVSTLVSNRIYPSIRPQDGPLPCIVFERMETEVIQTISSNFVMSLATMQVRAISATMEQADAISDAARTALAVYTHTDRVSAYDPDADVFISVTTYIVRD